MFRSSSSQPVRPARRCRRLRPYLEALETRLAPAVAFQFDYSRDTLGFFSDAAKARLEAAGAALSERLNDSLQAILPGGANTWTPSFTDPSNGQPFSVPDLEVPADRIIVFAAGRQFAGGTTSLTSSSGFTVGGSIEFVNAVVARGQTGALNPAGGLKPAAEQTDFGPRAGSIGFSTATNWFFGETTVGLQPSQLDFFTSATRGLAQLLGFGLAPSWKNRVTGSSFTGQAAAAVFGAAVPTNAPAPGASAWADGTLSDGAPATMVASSTLGARVPFTALDFAGLRDMGWEVNQAPLLAAVGNRSVVEQDQLAFTAQASDFDQNSLTFSLDAGAPAGAAITAAGAFTWTPSAAQGPGIFPITIRVTDNGTPALSDSETIQVTVTDPGVNAAPVLGAIGNRSATVGSLLTFTAQASDPDSNALSFSLDAGAPAGAAINAGTGVFTWTPTANQAPGMFDITVRVTDNGAPALSDSETFQVRVNATNGSNLLIYFDYSRDNTGFFNDPTRRATLDAAARALTSRLGDSLQAITPGGSNTWTAFALDPQTGVLDFALATNLAVPADTLIVYAGARDLPGDTAGVGGPGGSSASGSTQFLDTVGARGQAGALGSEAQRTDFGPWGGSITFDTLTNWRFSLEPPPAGSNQQDFLSVAEHELAHMLGFGSADSWFNLVSNNQFTGAASAAVFGALVPTAPPPDDGHWQNSILGDSTAMDPVLQTGKRVEFSALDFAGLDDMGWQLLPPLPPNLAPVLASIGNRSVSEGTLLTFTAQADDPNGNALFFSLDAGAPAGAAINPATGVFTWTPTPAQAPGTFPISVRVTDNGSLPLSDSEVIQVTVSEASNQAPLLAAIGNRSVTEGELLTFTADADDADGNALSFSLDAGAPDGAAINAATGVFTWTPAPAQGPGTFPITVRVTDNGNPALSDSETIQVTVNDGPNQAPVLASIGNRSVTEGNLLTFSAGADDVDGNALSFSLDDGAPAGAAINAATGLFTWTPTADQGPGTFPITLRVTDNGNPSLNDSETIQVTVNDASTPNQPPVLSAVGNRSVTEGNLLTFTAEAIDPDANALSFSLDTGAPTGAAIDASTGVFTWTPAADQGPGTFPITVRVSDNGSPSLNDSETIQVTVNDAPLPNQAPVLAALGNRTAIEGSLLTFTAQATDPDSDALSFSLDSGAPAGASINAATGVFTWTPTADQAPGTFPITVRVTDNSARALSDSETIQVTVSEVVVPPPPPPNRAPTAAADAATVAANSSASFIALLANDSDVDGDALTLTAVSSAGGGSILISGGGVQYTPAPGFSGQDSFTYTVSDGRGNTAQGVVIVTVTPPPPPPRPTVALVAPKLARARAGLFSLRPLVLRARNVVGNVTVRLTTSAGKLQFTGRGVRVRGNRTRTLTLTGSLTKVAAALRASSVAFGRAHGRARLQVSVLAGSASSRSIVTITF